MSKHVMIDLETWGKGPTAQIISIGAVKFDPFDLNGPWDNFHVAVDPRGFTTLPGIHPPFEIDPDTLIWWMDPKQNKARAHWLASTKLDLATTLTGFAEWFGPESLPTWGNGATFDNVILGHAFKACGMPRPWHYGHDRCYRTLRNLYPLLRGPTEEDLRSWLVSKPRPAEEGETGVPHTALYDAQWQTLHLLEIFDRRVPATPEVERHRALPANLLDDIEADHIRAAEEGGVSALAMDQNDADHMGLVIPDVDYAAVASAIKPEEHRCPRRDEGVGFTSSTSDAADFWRTQGGDPRTCSYCGSLHPDEFMACAEDGYKIGVTDKNYKVYVDHPLKTHAKFYFQHLPMEQRQRFIELLNGRRLNTGGYAFGSSGAMPFFVRRKKADIQL